VVLAAKRAPPVSVNDHSLLVGFRWQAGAQKQDAGADWTQSPALAFLLGGLVGVAWISDWTIYRLIAKPEGDLRPLKIVRLWDDAFLGPRVDRPNVDVEMFGKTVPADSLSHRCTSVCAV